MGATMNQFSLARAAAIKKLLEINGFSATAKA
jgi:hypothetical protein